MTTATLMKLSDETLEILKNFASLNSNILVKPGNTIKTVTPVKNVMGMAEVKETFEQEFGIWDLNKFLGTVSLFEDPSFSFTEKYVTISGGGSSVKYYYCEPSLLTTVNKELKVPEMVIDFVLTEEQLSELMRAASVLGLNDLSVNSDGGTLNMVVFDKQDPSSNTYTVELGEVPTSDDFDFHFRVDNLKMLPGDYTVSISAKSVSQFESTTRDLTYYVALESTSRYEG